LHFLKSAIHYGAKVSNYTKVEDFFITEENEVSGIVVRDLVNDRSYTIKGKLTINCTGPGRTSSLSWQKKVIRIKRSAARRYPPDREKSHQ